MLSIHTHRAKATTAQMPFDENNQQHEQVHHSLFFSFPPTFTPAQKKIHRQRETTQQCLLLFTVRTLPCAHNPTYTYHLFHTHPLPLMSTQPPTPTHQYTTTHTRTYMHARTRTSFVGIGVATKISRIKNSARWIRTSPFFDENSSRVGKTAFSSAQWSKPNTFIAKSFSCSVVFPYVTYISYWVKC